MLKGWLVADMTVLWKPDSDIGDEKGLYVRLDIIFPLLTVSSSVMCITAFSFASTKTVGPKMTFFSPYSQLLDFHAVRPSADSF